MSEYGNDIENVLSLLEKKEYKTTKALLKLMTPPDIADVFIKSKTEDIIILFRLLPTDYIPKVFTLLDYPIKKIIIETANNDEIYGIIQLIDVKDCGAIIENTEDKTVNRILKQMDIYKRDDVNKYINYKDDSVGKLMHTNFYAVNGNLKVSELIHDINKKHFDECINYTYILDKGMLVGKISFKDLLYYDLDDFIYSIMDTSIVSVLESSSITYLPDLFKKYKIASIPVTDTDKRLVGVLTFDSAMEVINHQFSNYLLNTEGILDDFRYKDYRSILIYALIILMPSFFSYSILSLNILPKSTVFIIFPLIPLIIELGIRLGRINQFIFMNLNINPKKRLRDKLFFIYSLISFVGILSFIKLFVFDTLNLKYSLFFSFGIIISLTISSINGYLVSLIINKCFEKKYRYYSSFIASFSYLTGLISFILINHFI